MDNDEAANNVLTVFVNYKVFDGQGRLLGVTGVGLRVENVAHRIGEYQEKYERVVYLTDTRGVIQVHPDTSFIEKVKITELEGMSDLSVSILINQTILKILSLIRNGNRILLTVRYIPSLDWFLYVEQNETNALVSARKNFIHTLLIGFLSFLTYYHSYPHNHKSLSG